MGLNQRSLKLDAIQIQDGEQDAFDRSKALAVILNVLPDRFDVVAACDFHLICIRGHT